MALYCAWHAYNKRATRISFRSGFLSSESEIVRDAAAFLFTEGCDARGSWCVTNEEGEALQFDHETYGWTDEFIDPDAQVIHIEEH